jgi:hypothetical protein
MATGRELGRTLVTPGGGGDNEHSQGPEFTQTSCQPLFTSYTAYQIVFGWSNQKGEIGGACRMHGELRKLMQKVGPLTEGVCGLDSL